MKETRKIKEKSLKLTTLAFTLVELLAVIVILSLLALLATFSITKLLKDTKEDLTNIQISSIKQAAETWVSQDINRIPKDGSCKYITLNDLKDNGLLDSKIVDSKSGKEIDGELKIKISSRMGKFNTLVTDYEVNPDNVDSCEYGYTYLDDTGASVELINGLTPVVYSKNSWKVADTTKEWYNYGKQEWANAVILNSGVSKKIGDTIDISSEVKAMFVYIPRYGYKIEGEYGKGGVSKAEPGEIEILFLSDNKDAGEGYIEHPAFTFGNKKIKGMWVGKFETSHITLSSSTTDNNLGCSNENCTNADGLRILPTVASIRYNDVSNYFFAAKSMTRNGNEFGLNSNIIDSHMMKNSEWGAVAYLSQSKYGKYGNMNYSGAEKEVIINNCSNFITGVGADIEDTNPSTSTCTTNTYETEKGQAASTTGNITGVYDMSGGAWEYVMGVLSSSNGKPLSGNSASSNSGFNGELSSGSKTDGVSFPATKYYDLYTSTDTSSNDSLLSKTACNGGICYGHALSETAGWYENNENFASLSRPWLSRGGVYSHTISGGIFDFNVRYGGANVGGSFRIVFTKVSN